MKGCSDDCLDLEFLTYSLAESEKQEDYKMLHFFLCPCCLSISVDFKFHVVYFDISGLITRPIVTSIATFTKIAHKSMKALKQFGSPRL